MSQLLYILAVIGTCGVCWAYARIEAYLSIRRIAADISENAHPESRSIRAVRLHSAPRRKRFAAYIPGRSSE